MTIEERRESDPSANVLLLVGNATTYLEKLYAQGQEFNDQKLRLAIETSQRERAAESCRVNALRAEDSDAIALANDRAIKQAELLNSQMLDNADVLRKSVENTAITIANQFEKMSTQQNERIAALERINAENLGKTLASPDIGGLVTQLVAAQNENKGASASKNQQYVLIGVVCTVIGAIGVVIGILIRW